MEKSMFQILNELNIADGNNGTATVGVCNSLVSANKVKAGGHVTMGVPENVVMDLILNPQKKSVILLVIDIAEYEKEKLRQSKEWIGLLDSKGRYILEGDMFFEETEIDEGDIRTYSIVTWIKEWAMFSILDLGEYAHYENSGVSALDDVSRNTYTLDEEQFKGRHYKGNVFDNPELLKLDNTQPENE